MNNVSISDDYYGGLVISGVNSEVPFKIYFTKNQAEISVLQENLFDKIIKVQKDESNMNRSSLYLVNYTRFSIDFTQNEFKIWDNSSLDFVSYEGAVISLTKNPLEAY